MALDLRLGGEHVDMHYARRIQQGWVQAYVTNPFLVTKSAQITSSLIDV